MRLSRWRASALLVIPLSLAIFAAACSGNGDSSEGSRSEFEPDAAQVLNVNLGGEPQTLDPQRAVDALSVSVIQNLFSGLLQIGPDLELVPDVAAEVPTVENGGISDDGLTYTFRLREGLAWSDGTPLTAQAFVDGARHLFEPGSANYYVDFYRILAADGPDGDANRTLLAAQAVGASGDQLLALEQVVLDGLRVAAPDDRTVVYHLNQRSPVFLLLASRWPLFPVRLDLIEAHGEAWTEAGTLVSNGPFRLDQWQHNESLRLVRTEHWHGPEVLLEVVNFDMIEDVAVAYLAYLNDELDVVTLGPNELVQVRNAPDRQAEFQAYAQLSTIGIYFNIEDPIFSSIPVRQAFAGALDREEYAEVVREGAVLAAFGWIPSGMPGHDEQLGRQFDNAIDESSALLREAGLQGASIVILSSQAPVAVQMAEWLKQQWERNLGVSVTINALETATYFAQRSAGNWQVLAGGWGADYPDPQNWLPLFRTGAGLNAGKFSNEEFDSLVTEAEAELDNDRRLELYARAQEILVEEVGISPLYYGRRNILVKPWVRDMVFSSMESAVPGDLYLDRVFISGRE